MCNIVAYLCQLQIVLLLFRLQPSLGPTGYSLSGIIYFIKQREVLSDDSNFNACQCVGNPGGHLSEVSVGVCR